MRNESHFADPSIYVMRSTWLGHAKADLFAILANDISSHVTNNNKLWKMIYLFSGKLVSLSIHIIDWGF